MLHAKRGSVSMTSLSMLVLDKVKDDRAGWAGVKTTAELIERMVEHAPRRMQGNFPVRLVLLLAGPGKGKTWTLLKGLVTIADKDGGQDRYVPLLIRVQELAYLLRHYEATARGVDLLRFYLEKKYGKNDPETHLMLLQALHSRRLVLMVDGLDEAAEMKATLEEYLHRELVPLGLRIIISSRPEGVQLELYQVPGA